MNVLWGLFNLGMAYALIVVVGSFEPQRTVNVAIVAAGFAFASVGLARKLGRLLGDLP